MENLKTLDDLGKNKSTEVSSQKSLQTEPDVITVQDNKNVTEEIQKAISEMKTVMNSYTKHSDPLRDYRSERNKQNPVVKEFRTFLKSIVYNRPDLMPDAVKNYLNESTNSAGGFLVPEEFGKKIYENVALAGVARRNATVVKMSREELKLPKLTTLPTFSFVSEGGLKPISNPGFSQVTLARKDGGFIVIFSKQLLEDEAFDLFSFVSNTAAKIISINEDNCAFRGLSPINGLLTPSIGATEIETSGAAFSSLTYDNLIDATVSVPSHSLDNSKFYMSRSVWGLIKKLKYSGSSEYVLSPDDRKEMMLEGYPVELTDGCYAMSESAADRSFIGFGDLSYLVIGERNSLTIDYSKEATVDIGSGNFLNLWQQGLVGLNFNVSFDMKFTFPEALTVIKTA
ncbi:MAG TPA: phage major capsid protein [Bacteroidetes bacterium]|nr:phage major capsid protein [Bacteroidota bacterium]HCN38460.1 phage major capsid protein [Bacteroidota bacterium]